MVAANHESVLDPPLLSLVTRRPLRFLAKEELWRYRPSAWLMDALGGVPVRRGRDGHVAVECAAELLAAGESVAIFPQGTVRGHVDARGCAPRQTHRCGCTGAHARIGRCGERP